MRIDFSAFEKVLAQLEESLRYYNSDLAREQPGLKLQFRAASIQAFEYSFELAVRMIRRCLETFESTPEVDHLQYRDLMRMAAEKGLIGHQERWFVFREKHNITAHTYDDKKAAEVAALLPDFPVHAGQLLEQLHTRYAAS